MKQIDLMEKILLVNLILFLLMTKEFVIILQVKHLKNQYEYKNHLEKEQLEL